MQMSLDDINKTTIFTTTSRIILKNSTGEFFGISQPHHLLPICLMAFVLLTLFLACLHDCKVNRDCCRNRSESGSLEASKTSIFLYDGDTGESRVPDGN
uniref:Uncharacterized protein n=2 Tax=Onchocerca TaxID=6281 RepID=A0A8R1XTY1_ONCVO